MVYGQRLRGAVRGLLKFTGDDADEPIIEPPRSSINGCVRAIDTDSLLGQPKERVLLCVGKGERLQATKDDGV
jgi:hypothetical protein